MIVPEWTVLAWIGKCCRHFPIGMLRLMKPPTLNVSKGIRRQLHRPLTKSATESKGNHIAVEFQ